MNLTMTASPPGPQIGNLKPESLQQIEVMNEEDSVRPAIVDFDENDLDNPRNWPIWRKWSIVIAVSSMTFVR